MDMPLSPTWTDIAIRLALTSWSTLDEVSRILGPMRCRAHFQERKLDPESQKADYTFELGWRRPEHATPPMDFLVALERRFKVKLFELTTDNGR